MAWLLIIAVLVIDQLIKIEVKTTMTLGQSYRVLDWFYIYFIENNGMAFGMELGSKFFLTWFRIIAVGLLIFYLVKMRKRKQLARGYVVCISLITAGALGNVIDCIFYGLIFNEPAPPEVAQLFPPDGGYQSLFNGRVVDMFYFPLCEWNWPAWMPLVGGEHFIFFQPIFNFADACLSVSVISLILFYSKFLAADKECKPHADNPGGEDLQDDNTEN